MGPNSAPSRTCNSGITQKMRCKEPPCPETIFRFGVLQLRLHRFETMHVEVVAFKVGYLNILQDRVCALFILQAEAVRIVVVQFGLLWLEVHEFSLVELRARRPRCKREQDALVRIMISFLPLRSRCPEDPAMYDLFQPQRNATELPVPVCRNIDPV